MSKLLLKESEIFLVEHPALTSVNPDIHNALVTDLLKEIASLRQALIAQAFQKTAVTVTQLA